MIGMFFLALMLGMTASAVMSSAAWILGAWEFYLGYIPLLAIVVAGAIRGQHDHEPWKGFLGLLSKMPFVDGREARDHRCEPCGGRRR